MALNFSQAIYLATSTFWACGIYFAVLTGVESACLTGAAGFAAEAAGNTGLAAGAGSAFFTAQVVASFAGAAAGCAGLAG